MKKYYTIEFRDQQRNLAGIVIVSYKPGDESPRVVSHAHCKNDRAYQFGYLLKEHGFRAFYLRRKGQETTEIAAAALELKKLLDEEALKE